MVGTSHLPIAATSLVTQVLVRGNKIQEVLSRFPPSRAASWPVESWLGPRPRLDPAMAAIDGPIAPPHCQCTHQLAMPKRNRVRCGSCASVSAWRTWARVRSGGETEKFVGEARVRARGKEARCNVHCTAPVFEYSRVPCAVPLRHWTGAAPQPVCRGRRAPRLAQRAGRHPSGAIIRCARRCRQSARHRGSSRARRATSAIDRRWQSRVLTLPCPRVLTPCPARAPRLC